MFRPFVSSLVLFDVNSISSHRDHSGSYMLLPILNFYTEIYFKMSYAVLHFLPNCMCFLKCSHRASHMFLLVLFFKYLFPKLHRYERTGMMWFWFTLFLFCWVVYLVYFLFILWSFLCLVWCSESDLLAYLDVFIYLVLFTVMTDWGHARYM